MNRARPMTKAERESLADAVRHMLSDGAAFHDVRRGTGIALPKMPRDIYLPRGHAKRFHKGVRS